jgi:L-malate glycosyltransferase
MKIAFVYDVCYPFVKGGVERRVWELAVRLVKRNHEVHIIGMKCWEGDDVLVREGVILHGICPATALYAGGRRTITGPLWFSARLIPFLLKNTFDIIDCQQFPYFPAIAVRCTAAINRATVVVTWHEVWGDYWVEYLGYKGLFGKAIERYVASLGAPVIAVSPATAARFAARFGRTVDRVIPNGMDSAFLDSVPRSPERSDIVFVGRLIKEKNTDLLVSAFRLLVSDDPALRLIIIGDGPEREVIREQIRTLSLEGNVRMTGFLDRAGDVIALMKASGVFALPSTREGFGIAALEALGCGLPVVTIDHGENAVRDLITEKTGFLSALSPADLAGALRHALVNREEMRGACLAAAAAYDWDRIAGQAEGYYRSLADRRRG